MIRPFYSCQLRLVLFGLFGLIGIAAQPARAQAPPRPDRVGRRTVPRLARPRLVALYDSRYSLLNGQLYTVNGLRAGIELRSRLRMGGAVYFLSNASPTRHANPADADPTTTSNVRFNYFAGYAEYVLLETPRWEVSATTQLGLGKAQVRYTARGGRSSNTSPDLIGIIEPSLLVQYRILRWVGVGAGVGWRQPVFVSAVIRDELNGPVFHLRGKLFLNDLIKALRGREPLFSQEGLRRK